MAREWGKKLNSTCNMIIKSCFVYQSLFEEQITIKYKFKRGSIIGIISEVLQLAKNVYH